MTYKKRIQNTLYQLVSLKFELSMTQLEVQIEAGLKAVHRST